MNTTCKRLLLLLLIVAFSAKAYPYSVHFQSDTLATRNRFPHWTIFAGMAGATGAALLIDENVSRFMVNNQTNFWKSFCRISDMGGEKTIVIPALLITYGTSFLIENKRLQRTAEASIKSVLATAIATETLKQTFGRARPYMGLGAFHSQPFPFNNDFLAMPSGHTSLAFAIFTPFAETYTRWIYIIPVSVAFGRVYQNRHWVSDVIVGGSLGFLAGYFFSNGRRQIEVIPNGMRVWF